MNYFYWTFISLFRLELIETSKCWRLEDYQSKTSKMTLSKAHASTVSFYSIKPNPISNKTHLTLLDQEF